jgi:CRP/FNR family transcriptional regulator
MEANFEVSKAFLESCIPMGVVKAYAEDEVLIREDSFVGAIPIVLSGSLKVIRTYEDGRELLLYYIKSGESCIMSFLAGMHKDTSKVKAVVEEPSKILFLPIEKLSLLLRENSLWLDYVFRLYHYRFEELLETVENIAFKKVDERLLLLLNKKSKLSGGKHIYVTHEQLATELGTARAVVSRLLKQLENEGKLQLNRNKITLLEK